MTHRLWKISVLLTLIPALSYCQIKTDTLTVITITTRPVLGPISNYVIGTVIDTVSIDTTKIVVYLCPKCGRILEDDPDLSISYDTYPPMVVKVKKCPKCGWSAF